MTNKGKTKNGHSVILRLQYRRFSVLFGGDLNTPAEHFLMRHYGHGGKAPTTLAQTREMIAKAGQRFGADLMKCWFYYELEEDAASVFQVRGNDDH